ncbi:MAG: hypothetical protein AB7O88_23700 [Reyranellaceae bacterium]
MTALAINPGSVASLVHRAAQALAGAETAAQVLDARDKARAAYSEAKHFQRVQKAKRAHDEVIAAAKRARADALEIEAMAERRLADEYDAAQERGEVGKKGQRSDLVPAENKVPTAEDVGLSRKEIYNSRQIRDAIVEDPRLVRRALDDILASGDEPTRAALKRELGITRRENLRAAVGTDTATAAERGNNLYETPPEAMRTLLSLMRFSPRVYEPACGKGAILRELEAAGYDVAISDLVDYGTVTRHGECQGVADFMTVQRAEGDYDIVTNPPYGADLNRFVAHALRVHRPRRMALLLNLNFLCGFDDPDRNFAMDECPPSVVYVFKRRLPMMHRDGWDGPEAQSRMNTAWFVWELDEATGTYDAGGKRDTRMLRVDWKVFENSVPCGPVDSQAKASEDNGATEPAEVPADSVAGDASRPDAGRSASATSEIMDVTAGETAQNSRPSVTSDELDEWRLLGLIDGGMRVSGPAVDILAERGLVWAGKGLTIGGAERLAELEPRIKAASDGDAVHVVDPAEATIDAGRKRGFRDALRDYTEFNRLKARSGDLTDDERARLKELAPVVAADLAPAVEPAEQAKPKRARRKAVSA